MARLQLLSCLVTAAILIGCGSTEVTTHRTASTYLRAPSSAEIDFQPLFDGRSFNGWKLLGKKGKGYGIVDGVLYCAAGGGGNLLTEKQYEDFILRFEFRLDKGANNGLAIRAPYADRALAYDGMELQILDNHAAEHDGRRRPTQYHGSLYDVAPARRGALRPAGEWNEQEVIAEGRRIRVTLNGRVILDVDLNTITDPDVIRRHPGLFRERGHIGFLGHNDYAAFRNIRIKELPIARVHNRPDRDFDLLFDGETLRGWRGFTSDAGQRGETARRIQQAAKDIDMRAHWSIREGRLETDGAGTPVVKDQDYANTELSLDYRVEEDASGLILLRGLPGVRLQGRSAPGNDLRLGSGGLHDGRFLYAAPKSFGDRFAGGWNRLRVVLAGDRAHVFVNDELVLKNTPFRNSAQPGTTLPETGPLGLFGEGGRIAFRNIQARDLGHQVAKPVPVVIPAKPPAPPEKPKSKTPTDTRPPEPGTMKLRDSR